MHKGTVLIYKFGSFEVNITLPENYLLCATGNIVNAKEELDFLNSKIIESQEKLKNMEENLERKMREHEIRLKMRIHSYGRACLDLI